MKTTKKVKSFRISPTTEYKLTRLKEAWNKSEGKVIEQLINSAYFEIYTEPEITKQLTPEQKEMIRIASAEWVDKF